MLSMKKILVTIPEGDVRATFLPQRVRERLEALFETDYNETGRQFTKEELRSLLPGYDAVLTGWGTPMLSEDVLSGSSRLKLIVHTGGTVGNLVDSFAYDRGITVFSGNQLYAESVAEGTLAYMLLAQRRLPDYLGRVREGHWRSEADVWEGLLGKTVGIVGIGTISTILIRMLQVFGVTIKVFSGHEIPEELISRYGVQPASLEEIFSTCDIVSLHSALNSRTRGGIRKAHFRLLKDNALLVNTARGDVLDEEALIEELQTGRIRAVLDVYHQEPLPANSPLRSLPNVYAIPHMGGPTLDRRPHITEALIREAERFFRGETDFPLEITRASAGRMTKM